MRPRLAPAWVKLVQVMLAPIGGVLIGNGVRHDDTTQLVVGIACWCIMCGIIGWVIGYEVRPRREN